MTIDSICRPATTSLLILAVCLFCGCRESASDGRSDAHSHDMIDAESGEEVHVAEAATVVKHTELKAIAALEALGGRFNSDCTDLLLTGGDVTDAGLTHVKDLTRLRTLRIMSNQITDQGLKHLAELKNLEQLQLHYATQITDAGIRHLSSLTDLRFLHLTDTQVTYNGRRELREALPLCLIHCQID